MMRVISVTKARQNDEYTMLVDGGRVACFDFKDSLGLKPGDRLVVVPAGEPLPGDEIERLKDAVHKLEETVTAEQGRANNNGSACFRMQTDNNTLTAQIHEHEDTIANLHGTIERLSKELAEARAEPTIKELCRAYGDWLKRAQRGFAFTALEILPDGSGWIKSQSREEQILVGWTKFNNPIAIIDAACRPEPEPVEPAEVKINFGTMSPELTAEVKQFLAERGLMK